MDSLECGEREGKRERERRQDRGWPLITGIET